MGTHGIRRRLGTKRLKQVTSGIEESFESRRYEDVAANTATLAAVAAGQDAATLFLAAAKAFKIAKENGWKADPDKVVSQAYRDAREVHKFRIGKQRVSDVKVSLKRTLHRYARSQSGSS
jgi:hypothetical protein